MVLLVLTFIILARYLGLLSLRGSHCLLIIVEEIAQNQMALLFLTPIGPILT